MDKGRGNERGRNFSEEKFFTWKATKNINAKREGERADDVPSEYRAGPPSFLPYCIGRTRLLTQLGGPSIKYVRSEGVTPTRLCSEGIYAAIGIGSKRRTGRGGQNAGNFAYVLNGSALGGAN